MPLSGQATDADVGLLEAYPELDVARLAVQLAMFRSQFDYHTLHEAKATLQWMTPEVRTMFSEVEQLVRLMLLCPVSSCEAVFYPDTLGLGGNRKNWGVG